ncbi:hypothetical protein CHCC15337_3991 [Bacillus paralicheniformis]|uniref:Uncharacterized protein n=1 Tax=Bacillus paralicheniformis TaxID=1648923 RepID=A0A7Z1B4B4_9BACI|nr:hypothetical protein B4121_0735 [Bacillus paralicheniformis]TWJ66148.1 hypothetical protein CHCC5021_0424 [Bacillus paralicheniformis]TWL03794.1 hypothetical protein CHCC19468_0652 [Bacillus paralicheniformis]TWL41525.1 hypothetical protein CHCC15337_3991 [Bacillus paralicheniformis]TWN28481.1 hypothetical protein CHCC14527_3915 [Bacillus paralicheniformis]
MWLPSLSVYCFILRLGGRLAALYTIGRGKPEGRRSSP